MDANKSQTGSMIKTDFISVLFQLLPLVINLVIGMVFFLVMELGFNLMENYTTVDNLILYITIPIGLVLAIGRFLFTYFYARKWKRFNSRDYSIKHWFISGIIYLILIASLILALSFSFPHLNDIMLWPILSIGFVGSYDLFLPVFNLLILATGESTGADPFVAAAMIILLVLLVVLPSIIFPNLILILGYRVNKRKTKDTSQDTNDLVLNES